MGSSNDLLGQSRTRTALVAWPGSAIILALLTAASLAACTFDVSGFPLPSQDDAAVPLTCGNGRLDPPEACDTDDLGGASCQSLGYFEGSLGCDSSCRLDPSGCGACGNDVKEPGEECDGGDYGAQTCADVTGKPHGVLACSFSCELIGDLCHHCGDGTLEPGEDCDGAELGDATCESLGYAGGTLGCLATCELDAAGCIACGDGRCDYPLGESEEGCPDDCARWAAVTGGGRHTCGLRATGKLLCWGDNNQSQLGTPPPPWNAMAPIALAAPDSIALPEAGYQHGCAITSDGLLHCWGDNYQGQLGQGATSSPEPPLQVPGLSGVALAAGGGYHTCAAGFSGPASCWGLNSSGQLGDGSRLARYTPTPVPGLVSILELDAGSAHTCAIAAPSGAWCWGQGGQGQHGLGTWQDALEPAAVPGMVDAVHIAAGQYHTCAARSDGTMACWGQGSSGQLGTGEYSGAQNSPQPAPILSGAGVLGLAAGRAHTCALLVDGSVECTGTNGAGQLGDGTNTPRPGFAAVSSLSGITAIAAGDDHTCALNETGAIWCWGQGNSGQLGEGETLNRNEPVMVLDPL
ncbi:MAG: hypothetical protein RBU30_27970 [Polyangia bacterium]|jgi:alpha-tubulin suppressor-like RCC1 family protein|nr:hypothetical protein [Polyangia bacterium]